MSRSESTRPHDSQKSGHKDLGNYGEQLAAAWLVELGHRVLGQQVRCPLGEIDLITEHRGQVVFVEVKTRLSIHCGTPAEAVTPAKQRQLARLALSWLKQENLLERPARFDVVTFVLDESLAVRSRRHYEHAFEAPAGAPGLY